MSTDPRAQPLPPHPSLEQQRKRARELLNAARAQEPRALLRFIAALPRLAGRTAAEAGAATLSLHEAQLVIARECGFPSWPKLKTHIESRAVRLTFERYNERARRVLFFSRHEAGQSGSTTLETEHVLLGLLRDVEGAACQILRRAQVSRAHVQQELDLQRESRAAIAVSIEIPFSAGTKRLLQCAADEADRLSHREIGVEHLLLAMLHQKRYGWQATIFGPGDPDANYGRWPYPLPSPTFAGLPVKIPRAFLILARKQGGTGEMVREAGDPGEDPLVTEYESQRSGPYIHA